MSQSLKLPIIGEELVFMYDHKKSKTQNCSICGLNLSMPSGKELQDKSITTFDMKIAHCSSLFEPHSFHNSCLKDTRDVWGTLSQCPTCNERNPHITYYHSEILF